MHSFKTCLEVARMHLDTTVFMIRSLVITSLSMRRSINSNLLNNEWLTKLPALTASLARSMAAKTTRMDRETNRCRFQAGVGSAW